MITISGVTNVYGLIGYPVTHSLSPVMQNAAFRATNHDAVYLCFPVHMNALSQAIEGMRSLGICGVNVTIPHKIAILSHLDKLDSVAAEIGAVNCVVNQEGILTGYNTDGLGALTALEAAQISLDSQNITMIGAGGTTKAIAYYLAPLCHSLNIINRTEAKAVQLALTLQERFNKPITGKPLNTSTLRKALDTTDILINTTSVGMHPNSDRSIIPQGLLHSDLVVFDVVYTPLNTQLLQDAELAGARTIDGLQMLVYQGAQAFTLWTGLEPPIPTMYHSAQCALTENNT
jgi:shikimate dehydrogenase